MGNRVELMSMVWKRHELKPIHMILKGRNVTFDTDGVDKRYDFRDEGWTINETMAEKFGDGNQHSFRRVSMETEEDNYTHKCKDGYYYNESWFAESLPIIVFDEKEFLL